MIVRWCDDEFENGTIRKLESEIIESLQKWVEVIEILWNSGIKNGK